MVIKTDSMVSVVVLLVCTSFVWSCGKLTNRVQSPTDDKDNGGNFLKKAVAPEQTKNATIPPTSDSVKAVSYADVQPLVAGNCVSCHGNATTLVRLDRYKDEKFTDGNVKRWERAVLRLNDGTMPPKAEFSDHSAQEIGKLTLLMRSWAALGFPETPLQAEEALKAFVAKGASIDSALSQLIVNRNTSFEIQPVESCTDSTLLPTRVWRLTDDQYKNSLEDVFGNGASAGLKSLPSQRTAVFSNSVENLKLDDNVFDLAIENAEKVSSFAILNQAEWKTCATSSVNISCARELGKTFGRRLWGRTLTNTEISSLGTSSAAVFSLSGDRAAAVRYVVERIILSPHFLFRSEIGLPDSTSGPDVNKLSPHEVAKFLSYSIYNSVPDDLLLNAADEGKLQDLNQIGIQIKRMLASPMGNRGMKSFLGDWLRHPEVLSVAKDGELATTLTSQMRKDLFDETNFLIERVGFQGEGGDVATLFGGPKTEANHNIMSLYQKGVSGIFGGTFTSQNLPSERAGLLTSPAVISVQSGRTGTTPTHRAAFFLSKVACFDIPPPPPGVVSQSADKAKDEMMAGIRNLRESISFHSSQAACSSCHNRLDPVALSFEIFDPIGRKVSKDPFTGTTPDVSGKLEGLGDMTPEFANAGELMRNLSKSQYFAHCVTRRYLEYSFGVTTVAPTSCEASRAYTPFKESGFKVKNLYENMNQLRNILYRRVSK